MKVLIVAGGLLSSEIIIATKLKRFNYDEFDYVIAVDSGYNNCLRLKIKPNLVIGDLDSVKNYEFKKNAKPTHKTIRLSKQKDHTDLHYAVNQAEKIGAESIIFICATGRRIDHFLNNLDILRFTYQQKHIKCVLVDEYNVITPLSNKKKFKNKSRYVSFIPITPKIVCSATNMKYPMDNFTIKQGNVISISNEATSSSFTVDIIDGLALVIQSD